MHRMVNGIRVEVPVEEEIEIQVEWAKNFDKQVAERYIGLRQESYPKIEDQLDALWHAMDQGRLHRVANFYHPIKDIKELYPKPSTEPTV